MNLSAKSSFIFCIFFTLVLYPLHRSSALERPIEAQPIVLVSIPPYVYFVDRIAGSDVKVETIVPSGTNPHLFEPAPKQVTILTQAALWLKIGESFEKKILGVLKKKNLPLKIFDIKSEIPLLCPSECKHVHADPDAQDIHIWLSPRLAKKQAENIANCLIDLFPEKKEIYNKNLALFIEELDDLDQEIKKMLAPFKHTGILTSHPAFGYFCQDYELLQLSVEIEGKDPLPQQVYQLIQKAQDLRIKNILLQPQYNNKGAKLIAEQLGLPTVMIDPYSTDYIANLRRIAVSIVDAHNALVKK